MFADNEIGRMVTTQEMKNLVDMCEARGLTQEEAIGEFHRRFGQPKATFSFTGEWPTSSSGRGRSESRGYDSGSASPSDSRLPSEGESLEGGAKMQPASLRYDRGDRDDGGLQEAPRRTYRGRSVEPDDEPAPARRGRDYSRPTALETADDEFWNNAPDGSSTGKYHYPPSTLARSRKVRAQAERDEARFARD